jgi:hypothetical protein
VLEQVRAGDDLTLSTQQVLEYRELARGQPHGRPGALDLVCCRVHDQVAGA